MISFVIPVYNCREYLKACVESVLPIEGSRYEILLIDDGSTDGSSRLCDGLAQQHTCIRCIHQENCGVSAARNRGIEEARGEWIIFADADDSVDLGELNALIQETECSGDIDAVLFGMTFDYYRKGIKFRSERLSVSHTISADKAQLAEKSEELYASNYFSPVWNKLFRRRILHNNGIRFCTDMFLLEDMEFSLRYLACCDKVLCSDRIVYHYRQAEDEGNAGRRLMRIPEISSLMEKLDSAFTELAVSAKRDPASVKPLITGTFLMLAKQKIAVSDRKTVSTICDDFIKWTHEKDIPQEELDVEYAQDLLKRRVLKLIARRHYVKLRHGLANRIKYLVFLIRGMA